MVPGTKLITSDNDAGVQAQKLQDELLNNYKVVTKEDLLTDEVFDRLF